MVLESLFCHLKWVNFDSYVTFFLKKVKKIGFS